MINSQLKDSITNLWDTVEIADQRYKCLNSNLQDKQKEVDSKVEENENLQTAIEAMVIILLMFFFIELNCSY